MPACRSMTVVQYNSVCASHVGAWVIIAGAFAALAAVAAVAISFPHLKEEVLALRALPVWRGMWH